MRILVKHINRVKRANGKANYYHRKTGERLPDDPQAAAARALEINATLGRPKRSKPMRGTFSDLVALYLNSPDYRKKPESTRIKYRRDADRIRKLWGDLPVKGLQRPVVIRLRNKMQDTPAAANHLIRVLSLLIAYGIDTDNVFGSINPAAGIKKIKSDGGYLSWPDNAIWAFKKSAPDDIRRLLIGGCLGTGARIERVMGLTWADIEGDRLLIDRHKGGNPVSIPIVGEFAEVLAEMPRENILIFTNNGKPWTYAAARVHWKRVLGEIGFPNLTPHGLRFTAARRLYDLGASPKEVKAVTGHRTAMMALEYAEREIDADRAMGRLHERK